MSKRKLNSVLTQRAGFAIILGCAADFVPEATAFATRQFFLANGPIHEQSLTYGVLRATSTPEIMATPASHALTNEVKPLTESLSSEKGRHPTNNENLDMLVDAVELRRLKKVEAEQLIASQKESLPALSICRTSGYGDGLESYERALARGHAARESLITRNMGLVHYCVKDAVGTEHFKKRVLQSLSVDDLVQEGAIGLSRAVDRWNPEIGGKFSTYAFYWIRAAVLRCIAERDDLVRVPVYVTSSVRKMTAAAKKMGVELGRDPSETPLWEEAKAAKQLAEAAGLSEAQLGRAIEVQRRRSHGGIRSFETWMQQGRDLESDHPGLDTSLSNASSSSSSSSSLVMDHLREELSKFLRPKEVEALSWRYGLTQDNIKVKADAPVTQGKWGEAMSFAEVGKRMHVSAEYTRRLCHKAVSKLRMAHEQGRLEPAALAP